MQRIIMALSFGKEEVKRVAWHKFWLQREKTDHLMYTALIDPNLNPTNLFYAYKHLINKLEDAQEMEKINLGSEVVAFHFIKPDRDLYVLWSAVPKKNGKKKLRLRSI
ncbi:MAG: hypothetical protein QXX95_00690 [Nitrososphaerales archaeon]